MDQYLSQAMAMLPGAAKTRIIAATGTAQTGATAKRLKSYEQLVICHCPLTAGNDADVDIYLPPVAECKGLTFVFQLTVQSGDANFNVYDYMADTLDGAANTYHSVGFPGASGSDYVKNFVLDAAADYLVLQSDGIHWLIVKNGIA